MNAKKIYILSAESGAGKSFLAETLRDSFSGKTVICCADDFFTDQEGNYNFNPARLGRAHQECRTKFDKALLDPVVENVIVANTNTSSKEYAHYKNAADEAGHICFRLIVDNIYSNEDVHGVPEDVKKSQKARIINSLT